MGDTRPKLDRPAWLALAVAGWTLIAWLPRIGILPVVGGWDLVRISVSILFGLVVAVALIKPAPLTAPLLYGFAMWTLVVWTRSLWNNWTLENPLGLRAVHTLLAAGFFYLAWRALATARSDPVARPDQGHRGQ